jgi:aconitase B
MAFCTRVQLLANELVPNSHMIESWANAEWFLAKPAVSEKFTECALIEH